MAQIIQTFEDAYATWGIGWLVSGSKTTANMLLQQTEKHQ